MKTALTLIGLLLATVVNAQVETTTVYDVSGGTPRIVSQQSRDLGMILIQRGNTVVIQTAPRDYYYGSGGWYGHRSHRWYGRSYRGFYRGR